MRPCTYWHAQHVGRAQAACSSPGMPRVHTSAGSAHQQQGAAPHISAHGRARDSLAVRVQRVADGPHVPLQHTQVVVRLRIGGASLDSGQQQRLRLRHLALGRVHHPQVVQGLRQGRAGAGVRWCYGVQSGQVMGQSGPGSCEREQARCDGHRRWGQGAVTPAWSTHCTAQPPACS